MPFQLNVSDADLETLQKKLEMARLPDEPIGFTVEQGVPVSEMHRLVEYWLKTYLPNWRNHEAALNRLPMYTETVSTDQFGDLDIHFIHQRSSVKEAIPLLFVHGWPGNFLEVTKLLPLLTEGGADSPAFHVVAPSLPNYGFSEGVSKTGFNLRHYGEVGDWGSLITQMMGRNYHENLRAVHINFVFFDPMNLLKQPLRLLQALIIPWTKFEWQGLKSAWSYITTGNAYYKIHQTRPQTVAYCLADSPVALLGWIYEKLLHWTDNYPWTEDEILTWVSIYWFSAAGPGASVRTYFEAETPTPPYGIPADKAFFAWNNVPLGLTQFPKDVMGIPRAFTRTLGNIVFENWASDGGHFAAWERPEVLARDLRRMFGRGGGAYGVVDGADGYHEDKKDA
ncbi:alpha/beta-hydrolase [Rhizodiscina lignyota]|uniref:Alpha/beta-hydrolase n=1 Tax=Rhizodiscina lignyota TaxID=1504668 RepID=A0A9P4M8L3_9PEZI|nr:alpha/beta-hydrolase [Rhizodiscina lignyota]